MAHRLWDLTTWSQRARDLLRRPRALAPDRPDALAPGFELSAAVLRHLQADPLLPAELLPAGVAGRAPPLGLRRVGRPLPRHAAGVEPGQWPPSLPLPFLPF